MKLYLFKRLLFLSCSFLSLTTFGQKSADSFTIGDAAPAVTISKWIKGGPVDKFEKGKVYVLEFWATWCLPCIAGMPHLSELAEQYRNSITFSGISIMERKGTSLAKIEEFVSGMGGKMDYHVAVEEGSSMADNWLKASGQRGIPAAYIIDRQGRIAWMGLPKLLDPILPKVLDGSWNIKAAAAERKEHQRLTILDNEVVQVLNPFMGNPGKPDAALMEINKIIIRESGLKYYPYVGHFTFYALLKTDQDKALQYGKEWLAANEVPDWRTITEAISYMTDIRKVELSGGLYELGAGCYQAQIDNYPWSMDLPKTYNDIALLWFRAGNKSKAIAASQRAIDAAKNKPGFSHEMFEMLKVSLEKFKAMK